MRDDTSARASGSWWVYLLDCDGRIYTGISLDPARRYREHSGGNKRGAKFTRAAKRLELLYQARIGSRSLALKAEARIKRLATAQKRAIVQANIGAEDLLRLLGLTATQ